MDEHHFNNSAIEALPPLKELVATLDMRARKSLGQNFLLDLNLTRRIARSAASLRQSCGLGMRTSASSGPATSDDDFVADQNAGDTGVRVAGRTRARA